MYNDYYKQLCAYKLSMQMAKSMLGKGVISQGDYSKIDKIIAKKYGINSCSIYRNKA